MFALGVTYLAMQCRMCTLVQLRACADARMGDLFLCKECGARARLMHGGCYDWHESQLFFELLAVVTSARLDPHAAAALREAIDGARTHADRRRALELACEHLQDLPRAIPDSPPLRLRAMHVLRALLKEAETPASPS